MEQRTVTGSRPTIWDVARVAGVSQQTVSRYLREDSQMRPETIDRVRAAIDQLQYQPNLAARSMRTRRSTRVGVFIPTMSHSGMAEVFSGAVEAAHEAGYGVEAFSVDGTARDRYEKVLQVADSGQVAGVLALAPLPPESGNQYPRRAVIVVSGDYDDQTRGIGELADGSPVADLMEHLYSIGHRRFVHITGDLGFSSARARRDVFIETVERLGVGPARVFEGGWTEAHGHDAVMSLREQECPTAIIGANDLVAAGAIQAARRRGWRVPEDVSITGWDNYPLSASLEPSLTTVDVDRRKLGRSSMGRLIATLQDQEPPSPEGNLNTIVWRDSVASADQGRH